MNRIVSKSSTRAAVELPIITSSNQVDANLQSRKCCHFKFPTAADVLALLIQGQFPRIQFQLEALITPIVSLKSLKRIDIESIQKRRTCTLLRY